MDLCDTCKQPDHCTGVYTPEEKFKVGQVRGCFKEKTGSLTVGRVPGGNNDVKHTPRKPVAPSWEKGQVGEHRPGGGFVPILTETGSPMGVKEYGERRREVDARLREVRQGKNLPGATNTPGSGGATS